jgi:succinyl-diaminopimelate desuccinylase
MPVVELTKELLACPSITPKEAGCHPILAERLKKLGFHFESLPFGDVDNFWARRGTEGPLLVFADRCGTDRSRNGLDFASF